MKSLILTSLISAVAVFAQSGSAPAPQNTPAPKSQTAVKKHKKSKKSAKPATPAAAPKTAASKSSK